MYGLPRVTTSGFGSSLALLLSWPGMKPPIITTEKNVSPKDDDPSFLQTLDLVQAVEYREQHFHTTVLRCHRCRRGNRKRAIFIFRSAKEVPHLIMIGFNVHGD